MKRIVKFSLLLLTLIVSVGVFWACKRSISNGEIVGNQVVSAPSGFTGFVGGAPVILLRFDGAVGYPKTIVNENPVLTFGTNRTVSLLNTMPDIVTWYVTFTGDSSHAVKSFTGTGNFIDSTSFKWDGSPDFACNRYFLPGETVICHVSFLGSSVTYDTHLLMYPTFSFALKTYGSGTKVLPDGVAMNWSMLDDYDYWQSGIGLEIPYSDLADGNEAMVFKVTAGVKVDGHFAYYAKGTDVNQNNYNGGFAGSLTELQNQITVSDPSQLYFNAYVYGFGRASNSFFFQVWENDLAIVTAPGNVTFPAGAPVFSKNDMWTAAVEVDWIGWKLVSVPYSSFKPASNPGSGGGGNRIKEPLKISGLAMEVDSYPTTGQTVELAFDMIMVSQNAPFQP